MTVSNDNPSDRILAAIRAIIREEFANLTYRGIFKYSIVAVSGSPPNVTLDCQPTDPTIGLPSLQGIPMQSGIDGITTIPKVGMNCVVGFLNADPTLPIIFGVDSLGVNPVARLGDQVTMFLPPTLAVVGTMLGSPFAGTIIVANPVTGVISQGSGKVFTG
jgi:hypothetical protein